MVVEGNGTRELLTASSSSAPFSRKRKTQNWPAWLLDNFTAKLGRSGKTFICNDFDDEHFMTRHYDYKHNKNNKKTPLLGPGLFAVA